MAIKIILPKLGESVVEGVIGRWLKKPGDRVEVDEPLVEVETDKVNAEIPATASGTLRELLAAEGDTVPVGRPIAILDEYEVQEEAEASAGAGAATSDQPQTTRGEQEQEQERPPHHYAPAVRRLAAETGIDPGQVAGTGSDGRVTRRDMETAANRSEAPRPGTPRGDGDEIMPLTRIRRTIAARMVESKRTVPHAWTMVEVDVTSLVRFREAIKEEVRKREGVNLTYLPFVIKAAVEGLREYPILNSQWDEDRIVLRKHINIAIAVDLEAGLTVPVIKDADQKSIIGLAHALHDLATRARAGALRPDDMQNGTFTINNTGAFGSIMSAPIINYPQAAILSMETIVKRPVVVGEGIAIRDMVNLCVSLDHRVLDGAVIGRFLRSVKRRLEAYDVDTPLY